TEEELRQKYHTLASKSLAPAKVRQLEEAVGSLEQLENVAQLSELLEP
ncbi:MAG: hypothetical protein HYX89_06335, partial [Chloroflexi bacterium]|nr:hypothetical protein [Chloroflexota bacterium]